MKIEYRIKAVNLLTEEEKKILSWGENGYDYKHDYSSSVIRYEDGVPVREIFNDEMDPEDAMEPLVNELNICASFFDKKSF